MKNKFVKLATLAIVSVMGLSVLAGCGTEAPAENSETKQEQSVDKATDNKTEGEAKAE